MRCRKFLNQLNPLGRFARQFKECIGYGVYSEAALRIVRTRHSVEWKSEFIGENGTEEDRKYHSAQLVGFETTLIRSRPMQVIRIHLKLDDYERKIDLLGPPIYAESIRLPIMMEMETTSTLRFKFPARYIGKTDITGKLSVFLLESIGMAIP